METDGLIFMDVSKEYYPILEQCGMMRGIAPQCYGTVLFCLQARTIDYQRGVHVAEVGEATRCAGVLLRGGIEEFLYDENGNQITVAHIHEGQIFGAELACSGGVTSPVCLRTASVCTVMLLNFGVLLSESSMGCPCRMQVTANLMQEFARQVMFFNSKIRILSQKKLRDKLKIYLQTLEIAPDGTVCLPYSRRELSEYLYADRSALSRELCKMRDEGILNFSGSRLQILDPDFLAI